MNQRKPMTKQEVLAAFKRETLPLIVAQHGNDRVAIRMAWNDLVDHLQKMNRITEKQARTWVNPYA